jgi:hypothetical protein
MFTRRWMLRAVAHCEEGCCTVGGALASPLFVYRLSFCLKKCNIGVGKVVIHEYGQRGATKSGSVSF